MVKLETSKGQLISKANCQAMNSSKKRTNEFIFTTMRLAFVRHVVVVRIFFMRLVAKGQLISKANCQAMNSSKKWTDEFIFTTMRRVFVCFFGRNWGHKKDISKLSDLYSVCFWGDSKPRKVASEINWPFDILVDLQRET